MELPIRLFVRQKNHHYVVEYCQSLSLPVVIYNEHTILKPLLQPTHINLFLYKIPDRLLANISHFEKHKVPIGLLNTEQLTIPEYLQYLLKLPSSIHLYDYSYGNQLIASYYQKKMRLLPYSYFAKELLSIPKTKEICMIYPGKSVRRHVILDQLRKEGIPIRVISGYGKKRDEELFQYKILLNIHFDKTYKIFEEIRCNRCIYHKMIVISETSLFDDKNPLKDRYISVTYEHFVAKVKDVIKNQKKYEEELFMNWNPSEKISQPIIENAGSYSTKQCSQTERTENATDEGSF